MLKVWGDRPGLPSIALNRPVCVVGRYGMHLSLESPTVSRTHALIINDARQVYIRDLASRNGTTVNGAAVHEAELAEAAVVRIGSYALRCESNFPSGADDVAAEAVPAVELHVDGHAVPIPIGQKTVLIGRREGCEIQLVDEDASPVHTVLFVLNGKRHVRDLNSENGTFVNGQPVRQAELRDGDEIRIGRTKIRYMIAGSAAASAASDDIEMLSPVDDTTAAAGGNGASPRMHRSLDEVFDDALGSPVDGDIGVSEFGPAEADIDVEIEPEDEAAQADFGSTALESNFDRIASTPLPPRALGDLDEPDVEEPAAPSPDAPAEQLEPFVDGDSSKPSLLRDAGLPETATPDIVPSEVPSDAAPSDAAPSEIAPSEIAPPADAASPEHPPMTGATSDAVSDAPASLAVEADQMPEAVDASTGPIALGADDELIELVDDAHDGPDAAAAAPESTEEAGEVFDAPAEVVDGKVVSPPPFADGGPLTGSPVAPSDAEVVRAAPGGTPAGVFARADLTEPTRPPGLMTGAAALPAPPAGAVAPAPQPRLEPMDDAAVADVVAKHAPPASDRTRRPTRLRVRQLSRRVRELTARVAALEAALLVARGAQTAENPTPADAASQVVPTNGSSPHSGRDR